jgi:hypothetical protein
MRYRLDVIASSVVDVVRFAGGWLCDRVMAGWDVTVIVPGHPDGRALQILGADMLDLESALGSWRQRPRPQTLATGTALLESDWRIRDGVLKALDHGLTEVTLWGDRCPAELDRNLDPVQHQLSAAARAFKALALATVAPESAEWLTACESAGDAEAFLCGVTTRPSIAADLIPAS